MAVAAVISLTGLVLTALTLPEPMQRSLEDVSGELEVMEEHNKAQMLAAKI